MRLLPLLILATTTLFFACGPDGDVGEDATLTGGRWELTSALRNGMETEMLEGLFFEFGPEGELQTNLMGNEAPGSYVMTENTVATAGVVPPLEYEVTELTDSSLVLRTELQSFRFDFSFRRVAGGVEAPSI